MKRTFLIIDRATSAGLRLEKGEDDRITSYHGASYSEDSLRKWANDRWGTPTNATLNEIARDIKSGGWILFEFIVPVDPDPERAEKPKLGEIKELGRGRVTPHPDR